MSHYIECPECYKDINIEDEILDLNEHHSLDLIYELRSRGLIVLGDGDATALYFAIMAMDPKTEKTPVEKLVCKLLDITG